MKYIVILLLSLNVYAQETSTQDIRTPEQKRVDKIHKKLKKIGIKDNSPKSQGIIAELLTKCNITYNSAFFYERLFRKNNTEKLDCFVSKNAERLQDIEDKMIKKAARKTILKSLNNYDCSTIIEPYSKLLCEARN